jgi:RHS repeat-associated protein
MGCLKLTYNQAFESSLKVVYRTAAAEQKSVQRFLSVDPLADHPKQVGTSPYAFVANNPLRYIDPTGMIWEDPKQAEKLNTAITNRIERIDKNSEKIQAKIDQGGLSDKKLARLEGRLSENSQKTELLNQSLSDIEAIGNAAETYRLTGPSANDGTHGVVKGSDEVINIEGSNTGLHIHEIRHVGQSIEAGGVMFNKDGRLLNAATTLRQARQFEVEAYQVQYSYDGSYPAGASSLKDINEKSLMQIKLQNGGKVYKDLEDKKKK